MKTLPQTKTIVLIVLFAQVMRQVLICPKNASGTVEAQKRLNCGDDKYGNNQYLCLPDVEKTALYEFCHDGIMGWRQNGKGRKKLFVYCNYFVLKTQL